MGEPNEGKAGTEGQTFTIGDQKLTLEQLQEHAKAGLETKKELETARESLKAGERNAQVVKLVRRVQQGGEDGVAAYRELAAYPEAGITPAQVATFEEVYKQAREEAGASGGDSAASKEGQQGSSGKSGKRRPVALDDLDPEVRDRLLDTEEFVQDQRLETVKTHLQEKYREDDVLASILKRAKPKAIEYLVEVGLRKIRQRVRTNHTPYIRALDEAVQEVRQLATDLDLVPSEEEGAPGVSGVGRSPGVGVGSRAGTTKPPERPKSFKDAAAHDRSILDRFQHGMMKAAGE